VEQQRIYWEHFGDAGEPAVICTCTSCGERITRGMYSTTRVYLCGGCSSGIVGVAWQKAGSKSA